MARTIIVPLDQSHIAECALPYARALAARARVPITLLCVVEPSNNHIGTPADEDLPSIEEPTGTRATAEQLASLPIGINPESIKNDPGAFDALTSALTEAEEYLTYIADSIPEVPHDKMVVYGDAVEQIIRAGAEKGDDDGESPILVMASHGRSGVGRVLLGSVALSVAERATCPTMIVRALRSQTPLPASVSLDRILIALDGSIHSEAVIKPVADLFARNGAVLHLVRVLESTPAAAEFADSIKKTSREEAEQYLEGIASDLSGRGLKVYHEVFEGNPAIKIIETADALQADVMALATHGHSGLKRLAIGSVAEEVLNHARRPLLLVRPEDESAIH
jgi:nucleotide-binding universal stress UspA family protein